ncbi:hypothetical protein AHF37_06300 [Paragonimus kellicotti]|nr:hypothetical protein AHF37_06300 [Paragonimus kellicotti]
MSILEGKFFVSKRTGPKEQKPRVTNKSAGAGQSSGDNIVGSLAEYASTADHPTYLYESLLKGVLLKVASSICWMLVTTLRVPEDGKSSSLVLLIKTLLQLTQIYRQKHEARAGTMIALKAMRILYPILVKIKEFLICHAFQLRFVCLTTTCKLIFHL